MFLIKLHKKAVPEGLRNRFKSESSEGETHHAYQVMREIKLDGTTQVLILIIILAISC